MTAALELVSTFAMRVLVPIVAALSATPLACTIAIDRAQFACSAGGVCDREDTGVSSLDAEISRDGTEPDPPDARADLGTADVDAGMVHLDAVVLDGTPRDASPDAQPQDAGAPLGAVCAANANCASTVCFDLGGMTGRRCVRTCGTEGDCTAGETCYSFNGAKLCLAATFFPNAAFTTGNGGSCTESGQCRSNYCSGSVCVGRCDVDGDCTGSDVCSWHTLASDDLKYIAACDGPTGTAAIGASCTTASDCRTGVCRNSICAELCKSDGDCSSTASCAYLSYSECVMMSGSECVDEEWNVNVVKACVEGEPGTLAVGASCTMNEECRSFRCHSASGTCASACSTDRDCPSTHRCKIAETALTLGDAGPRVLVDLCLPVSF